MCINTTAMTTNSSKSSSYLRIQYLWLNICKKNEHMNPIN